MCSRSNHDRLGKMSCCRVVGAVLLPSRICASRFLKVARSSPDNLISLSSNNRLSFCYAPTLYNPLGRRHHCYLWLDLAGSIDSSAVQTFVLTLDFRHCFQGRPLVFLRRAGRIAEQICDAGDSRSFRNAIYLACYCGVIQHEFVVSS